MHIADEIMKYLACEICFQSYDEAHRLPYSLFPCGHTFCEQCICNLNKDACPACGSEIQFKAKNWAIINLIPKARIPPVFDEVEKLVQDELDSLRKVEESNKESEKQETVLRRQFEAIRNEINEKTDDLIERIKETQGSILSNLNEAENEIGLLNKSNQEWFDNTLHFLNQVQQQLHQEEVKTNENDLNQIKGQLESQMNELAERLNKGSTLQNLNVEFIPTDVDFGNVFNIESLFGSLVLKDKDNMVIDNTLQDDTTSTQKNNEPDNLSELETNIIDSYFNDVPSTSNTRDVKPLKLAKSPQIVEQVQEPIKIEAITLSEETPKQAKIKPLIQISSKEAAQVESGLYETQTNISVYKNSPLNKDRKIPEGSKSYVNINEPWLSVSSQTTQAPALSRSSEQRSASIAPSSIDASSLNPVHSRKISLPENKPTTSGLDQYRLVQANQIELDGQIKKSQTRICRLVRTSPGELYGFDLKTFPSDGRHIANNIIKDSPAYRAGLLDGDIILEVNGHPIRGLDKNQVIQQIKSNPNEVEMLVVYYKQLTRVIEDAISIPDLTSNSNSSASSSTSNSKQTIPKLVSPQSNIPPPKYTKRVSSAFTPVQPSEKPKPTDLIDSLDGVKTIKMEKRPEQVGYGFAIGRSSKGPHYISGVEDRSPASNCDLKVGELILKINSINLLDKTYLQVVETARKECMKNELELVVIDSRGFPHYLFEKPADQPPLQLNITAPSHESFGKRVETEEPLLIGEEVLIDDDGDEELKNEINSSRRSSFGTIKSGHTTKSGMSANTSTNYWSSSGNINAKSNYNSSQPPKSSGRSSSNSKVLDLIFRKKDKSKSSKSVNQSGQL